MAKCDDVEVKRLFLNIVTTMAAVLVLDKAIQTVIATLGNVEHFCNCASSTLSVTLILVFKNFMQ